MNDKKPDKRTMSKIYPENVVRLKKVIAAMEERTKIKPCFDPTVNAAIAFGLVELEKQNGVK